MNRILLIGLILVSPLLRGSDHILIIQGAGGEQAYEEAFSEAADLWVKLATDAEAEILRVDTSTAEQTAKQSIQNWVTNPDRETAESIWIVYLGHGTYNAGGAKLNLTGPDVSSDELGAWVKELETELVFIHGGSASAPFISSLSGPNRAIITATRSGSEVNYARFGEYFAFAISDSGSDIDLDGKVSLLEAFISASSSVETFYLEAGRLSSEHALLDDNADARGTPASAFAGLRIRDEGLSTRSDGRLVRNLTLSPPNATRALTPEEIKERNRLEGALEDLYQRKGDVPEDRYFDELESILNELSKLYIVSPDS